MSMTISITRRYPARVPVVKTTALRRQLRRVLELLEITAAAWSVTLVDDAAMAELHARTMNMPDTTDVLTFDLRDGGAGRLDLDTVICIDEAARRAMELGHDLDREILLYAIHSLLHVQGYDDQTPAKFRRMHAKEDQILTRLGVGPVYKKAKR